jgi:hypothetical protein
MESPVRRFKRWFARDVACYTTYILVTVVLLTLIQTSVRLAPSVGTEQAEDLISKAQDILTESLLSSWPLVCTMGLCIAMAQWVSRGKDLIVASAGLPFRGIVRPGLLLALTILVTGSSALSSLGPAETAQRATWADGDSWGAVLAPRDRGWHWVEFRERGGDVRVQRGIAEISSDLPDSAKTALATGARPLIGGWERGLFLLLAAGLMLSVLPLGPARVGLFAFGIPLVGWFAWVKILGTTAAMFGSRVSGGLSAAALTFLVLGVVSFGALQFAKK